MQPSLGDAASPEAVRGRDFMVRTNMLDKYAQDLNEMLNFPFDIPLKGQECGEENLYWSPDAKEVVLCYEGMAHVLDQFAQLGVPDPERSAYDTETLGFYHEAGHMVIDVFDLPAIGREEDDADQMSVYLMLRPDAEGKVDPAQVQALDNAIQSFAADADTQTLDDAVLADTHSPTKTRLYDLECWAYGADPGYGEQLVADGLLPEERAEGCADEYKKLRSAWDRLLEPYLK